jgi:hypothetical protein
MSENLLKVFNELNFSNAEEKTITGNYNGRVLLVDGL